MLSAPFAEHGSLDRLSLCADFYPILYAQLACYAFSVATSLRLLPVSRALTKIGHQR